MRTTEEYVIKGREKRSRVDDWRCRQKIGGGEGKKKD